MKLRQYLLVFLVATLVFSCKEQPKCNSTDSILLSKKLIVDYFSDDFETNLSLFGLNVEGNIEEFINNNVDLVDFRTTGKKTDLQMCDCTANISFTFSEEFMSQLNEQSKNNSIISAFANKIKKPIPFNFKLQITEDNSSQHIEGIIPGEEIGAIYTLYALLGIKKKEEIPDYPQTKTEDSLAPIPTF